MEVLSVSSHKGLKESDYHLDKFMCYIAGSPSSDLCVDFQAKLTVSFVHCICIRIQHRVIVEQCFFNIPVALFPIYETRCSRCFIRDNVLHLILIAIPSQTKNRGCLV